MKIKYIADDGAWFDDEQECLAYEIRLTDFRKRIIDKIGDFSYDELCIGNMNYLISLPYTVICEMDQEVIDIRRNDDNIVEFLIDGEWRTRFQIDDSFMDDD